MEWWTARRINSWERARRGVTWLCTNSLSNRKNVTLRASDDLADATILSLSLPDSVDGSDEERFTAWGFIFAAKTRSIRRDEEASFDFG